MNPKPYLREISLKSERIADFTRYPFSLPVVRQLGTLRFHPDVTFLAGENGSGKSTLLEAIAVALGFNPEGGSRSFSFTTRPSHSELHSHLRVVRSFRKPADGFFLRAESFFNVATEIERLDSDCSLGVPIVNAYGGHSLHEQSHGESFWALVMKRFRGKGLYILDEPEAALSPKRQLILLRRIHELVEQQSQFIIATHSPILLAYPQSAIFVLNEQGLTSTPYECTEHFKTMRAFIANPEEHLRQLLSGK